MFLSLLPVLSVGSVVNAIDSGYRRSFEAKSDSYCNKQQNADGMTARPYCPPIFEITRSIIRYSWASAADMK